MSGDFKAISAAQGGVPKPPKGWLWSLRISSGAQTLPCPPDAQEAGAVSASANASDAVIALEALGFQRSDASLAVGRLDSGLDTETPHKAGA